MAESSGTASTAAWTVVYSAPVAATVSVTLALAPAVPKVSRTAGQGTGLLAATPGHPRWPLGPLAVPARLPVAVPARRGTFISLSA